MFQTMAMYGYVCIKHGLRNHLPVMEIDTYTKLIGVIKRVRHVAWSVCAKLVILQPVTISPRILLYPPYESRDYFIF